MTRPLLLSTALLVLAGSASAGPLMDDSQISTQNAVDCRPGCPMDGTSSLLPYLRPCLSDACGSDTTICDATACWDDRDHTYANRPGNRVPIPPHPPSGNCRVVGQTTTGATIWECEP